MVTVRQIMMEFADLTGLLPSRATVRRYLWTDAFAVCNFLELYRQTRDEEYQNLSLRLVDKVHTTLGRHREDDRRSGWISGLGDEEGKRHPTSGGLRIGKGMIERDPEEPYDETLEWDRDGQYFHYLTKWMHALNRVTKLTGNPTYNRWAIELARAVHARFTHFRSPGGSKGMYWKMSIDLSRPLVPSMGQHDPLDGYITYMQVQATAKTYQDEIAGPDLLMEILDMERMCQGRTWTTDDPLGIGGLLCDAYRAAQLDFDDRSEKDSLLAAMLESSLQGLRYFAGGNPLRAPAGYRLAFRELGLSLGLRALQRLQRLIEKNPGFFGELNRLQPMIQGLHRYLPLAEEIESFWLERANRESATWKKHREINMVMLATSLAPEGYLAL